MINSTYMQYVYADYLKMSFRCERKNYFVRLQFRFVILSWILAAKSA